MDLFKPLTFAEHLRFDSAGIFRESELDKLPWRCLKVTQACITAMSVIVVLYEEVILSTSQTTFREQCILAEFDFKILRMLVLEIFFHKYMAARWRSWVAAWITELRKVV